MSQEVQEKRSLSLSPCAKGEVSGNEEEEEVLSLLKTV